MGGDEVHARDGSCGAICATTEPLTEPTSETIAPGLRRGPIASATAPQAPTGTQSDDEVGVPTTPRRRRWNASSAMAELAVARDRRTSESVVRDDVPARFTYLRRAARAMDEPISPMPIERDLAVRREAGRSPGRSP
jgi:hypothetical protein